MAGISDKALKGNYAENKYRFQQQELQNKEFSDGSGLEMYEFKYRFDDPQIGRFWSVDPIADSFPHNSPYAFSENRVINGVELEGLEWAGIANPSSSVAIERNKRMDPYFDKLVQLAWAPWNTVDRMNAAGNTHNPELKKQFQEEAKEAFTQTIINEAGGIVVEKLLGSIISGFAKANPFNGLTSINEIGATGENLTKGILEKQFPGADILEQANLQLDGAKMVADFVVVKDGKVIGLFESKVDGSRLSNGQKLFFQDGDAGVLNGKNVPQNMQGVKVDPATIQKGVYRWDSTDATFKVE